MSLYTNDRFGLAASQQSKAGHVQGRLRARSGQSLLANYKSPSASICASATVSWMSVNPHNSAIASVLAFGNSMRS